MKFKIPFMIADIDRLKRRARFFSERMTHSKKSKLAYNLENVGISVSREEYIGICLRSVLIFFVFLFIISTSVFAFFSVDYFLLFGLGIAALFSIFVFFSQMVYPRIYIARRQREIEKNLIFALEDILVQLNSGIPLFSIMVNISSADYGELSAEFKKAVKRINAGEPEEEVLDDLGKRNPSVFFRRTLWQISNGMKAGSDMSIIIRDSIKALNEEQLIQIQNYGNKLNPLIMFYLLMSIILPALSITFLTILSSMVGLPKNTTILIFLGLFVFVGFIQIMFLGMIKSRRPSLL